MDPAGTATGIGGRAGNDVTPSPSGDGASASGSSVARTEFESGLRVVTERMPGVRSVTFGIWVTTGSRDERPEIILPEDLRKAAERPLLRMLDLS